jgi:hypothetical protein
MNRIWIIAATMLCLTHQVGADTPREVFEKRIEPIFRSPNPSSCVQCHLAGVDLKNYIRPTHEATFVSLRDQGLIDLEHPGKSKILQLIRMGEEDKAGAALIHQKNRTAEYEAFALWIEESAADPALRRLPKAKSEDLASPPRPVEVIRHARKDRLAESFTNSIWALRFRCMSCHLEGNEENQKLVEKHGKRVAWFKQGGPEATLDYLMSSRLIDVKNPRQSLLLRKPLAEVDHGGGKKMLVGDQGYRLFFSFLEDFARIKNDTYVDVKSLPANAKPVARFGSESWLKLANTPAAWGDRLVQVDVYAWDAKASAWESRPIATSDRQTWGKGQLWQHNLTLLADPASDRAKAWRAGKPALAAGKYLVKVLVDTSADAANQPELSERHYAGQAEVTSSWPEGYGRMTVLDAARFKK